MFKRTKEYLKKELQGIRDSGLYKDERIILSDQKANIDVSFPEGSASKKVLNFCANNYLGLANNPKMIEAAHKTLDKYGFGLSSVRFICGTQNIHKELEKVIAKFYETEDTILYTDGIRLCKAKRYVFAHADMNALEEKLKEARENKTNNIIIATDGVFSMDGDVGNVKGLVELGEKYDAMVMVDDSHATGFFGERGRGAVEYNGVLGKVDIITSTLGKAMGGASGGFTTGRKEIIEILRQRSRPYLFSNTVAPAIVGASIAAFKLLDESNDLRVKLRENTKYFREKMNALGFDIVKGVHPIVPVMFGKYENDAQLAQDMSKDLYNEGIYVIGFFYPVVPKGQARIRVQISAAHSREDLDKAINAFEKIGKKHKVI